MKFEPFLRIALRVAGMTHRLYRNAKKKISVCEYNEHFRHAC